MKPILECYGLSKSYGNGRWALSNLNLSLERGQIVGLLGPNGSGKTTLIKVLNGLLQPEQGLVLIDGETPGLYTKSLISYLPDKPYFSGWMKVNDLFELFEDFYADFDSDRAYDMLNKLNINPNDKLKTMSKGTKEKVQLILVMSRDADVYFLDEPIGGVDPAARDYILNTIITNYNPKSTVIISTHLISDIEKVLDDVVMIKDGELVMHKKVDDIREEYGKSVDEVFREVFKC